MLKVKIADSRKANYLNIGAGVSISGNQIAQIKDENINDKLLNDIRNGILRIVEGEVPRKFQEKLQATKTTNTVAEVVPGADGIITVFNLNSYLQKVTPLEKISVYADTTNDGLDNESRISIIPSGVPSAAEVKVDLSSFPGELTFGTAPIADSLVFVFYEEDKKTDDERLDRLERIGQLYEPFIL